MRSKRMPECMMMQFGPCCAIAGAGWAKRKQAKRGTSSRSLPLWRVWGCKGKRMWRAPSQASAGEWPHGWVAMQCGLISSTTTIACQANCIAAFPSVCSVREHGIPGEAANALPPRRQLALLVCPNRRSPNPRCGSTSVPSAVRPSHAQDQACWPHARTWWIAPGFHWQTGPRGQMPQQWLAHNMAAGGPQTFGPRHV